MMYTRAEQETSIIWDEEEKEAHIYTASPISMRRLNRLCEEFPGEYKCVWVEQSSEGQVTAAKYTAPSMRIKFGKPSSEARVMANRRNLAGFNSKP